MDAQSDDIWHRRSLIFKGIKYPSAEPLQKGGVGSLTAVSLLFPFRAPGSLPLPAEVPAPPCYPPDGTMSRVPWVLPARVGPHGAAARDAPSCYGRNPAPMAHVRGGTRATGSPEPRSSPVSVESHPRRVGGRTGFFSIFGETWRSCRGKRQSLSLFNGSPEECFTRYKILLPAP